MAKMLNTRWMTGAAMISIAAAVLCSDLAAAGCLQLMLERSQTLGGIGAGGSAVALQYLQLFLQS